MEETLPLLKSLLCLRSGLYALRPAVLPVPGSVATINHHRLIRTTRVKQGPRDMEIDPQELRTANGTYGYR